MILVTGFLAKEGTTNASEILVNSLIDRLPEELEPLKKSLHFDFMIDDPFALSQKLKDTLGSVQPRHCIFIGQAPGRNKITLERVATNHKFTGPPPKLGQPQSGEAVVENASAAYMATLPDQHDIVEVLHQSGIPAGISNDAGNGSCNQILYETLHIAETSNLGLYCGFVHIPALPEQVISDWPQNPFMPLEMTRLATTKIIEYVFASN